MGTNLFAYCYNASINMVDYNGRVAITLTVAGLCLFTAVVTMYLYAIISSSEFQRSWNHMCSTIFETIESELNALRGLAKSTISWVSSQAESIANSIRDSFARMKTKPNYKTNHEIHHLVAKAAQNASYAASILRKVFKDGVENLHNKLRIKTGLHRRIHTNVYYGWSNSIVISAYNAAKGNKTQQFNNVLLALSIIKLFVKKLDDYSPY